MQDRATTILFFLFFICFLHADTGDAQNLDDCLMECRDRSNCVACSTLSDCGSGYADLGRFDEDDDDKTWYSCRRRGSRFGRRSETLRGRCIRYCRENLACSMCSTYQACGPDYHSIAHFTGRGRNWHACASDTPSSRVGVCRGGVCTDSGPPPPPVKHGTVSTVSLGR